mmetsp:Transcript_117545/g.219788  ORF Transcript_117545/g.219788 Transcript_117545/m.219788 type:complete len:228 (-) Transcript_117545:10-693(-)
MGMREGGTGMLWLRYFECDLSWPRVLNPRSPRLPYANIPAPEPKSKSMRSFSGGLLSLSCRGVLGRLLSGTAVETADSRLLGSPGLLPDRHCPMLVKPETPKESSRDAPVAERSTPSHLLQLDALHWESSSHPGDGGNFRASNTAVARGPKGDVPESFLGGAAGVDESVAGESTDSARAAAAEAATSARAAAAAATWATPAAFMLPTVLLATALTLETDLSVLRRES